MSISLNLQQFIKDIREDDRFSKDLKYRKILASRKARFASLNPALPRELQEILDSDGIKSLYIHQVDAVNHSRDGKNVVTVTPTASGKTFAYLLPILESIIKDENTHALMLFPLKALAQDQLKRLKQASSFLKLEKPLAAIFDGDTTQNQRAKLKKNPPHILLTNPDMLHHGFLAHHTQWSDFFRHLKYVVVDEIHTYKGIFGSHVLQIMRRLNRITSFYRVSPQYFSTSATIANPEKLAEALTGRPFELVENNGAPTAKRTILFVNPIGNVYTSAVKLFVEAINNGFKTILFTKARKITELIHQWTIQSEPDLVDQIRAYRAGYLPSERREIEKSLKSGDLKGVISTSALEMGIDIGGLDVCILVGYPGTITNTWQRAGRVGRGSKESAVFLIAQQDQLDQYFMRYPEDFFRRSAEEAVVDKSNLYLLKNHLACAAQEVPLRLDEKEYDLEKNRNLLNELVDDGVLAEAAKGQVWFSKRSRPHSELNIRGAGESYPIIEKTGGRLVGHVSGLQAMTECHDGAIYLHQGKTYYVNKLDLGKGEVQVRKKSVSYYTRAKTEKETEILEVYNTVEKERYTVSLGLLKVTEKVTGYERRSNATKEKIDSHELDFPPVVYKTIGLWIQPEVLASEGLAAGEYHEMGSLHATEHASLALIPLIALCDRNDVGGISFTMHPDLKTAAIFLYDGHPGGVGLADKAFHSIDKLLDKVIALVEDCECEDGCPSCIHSPKCGHGNIPLDKNGCVSFLKHITCKEILEIPDEKPATETSVESTDDRDNEIKARKKEKKPEKNIEKIIEPYKNKLPLTKGRDIVVFDLETQLSAAKVGGWHNAHLMRVSLGVIYERKNDKFSTYYEDNILDLIDRLKSAELVVGYNSKRFDYVVLSGYSGEDFGSLPSLDLLAEIERQNGHRVKLDTLGSATLNSPKSADGLMALKWWNEGKIEEIEKYCRMDVEITANLMDHALKYGYLISTNRDEEKIRLPLNLPIELLLK